MQQKSVVSKKLILTNRLKKRLQNGGKNTAFYKLGAYSRLVMLSHSLFSLPYGFAAMFMASGGTLSRRMLPTAAALIFVRSGANAFNRFGDRRFDALNPRTRTRQIPVGEITAREALLLSAVCFAGFFISVAAIGGFPAALMPFAAFATVFYTYTKRFTSLCHLILGAVCALSPVGAFLAVADTLNNDIFLLGASAALQTAAADILYALCDQRFDSQYGLHSFPADFGKNTAISFASFLQFLSIFFMVILAQDIGFLLYPAVAVNAVIMIVMRKISLKSFSSVYRLNAACTLVFSSALIISVRPLNA